MKRTRKGFTLVELLIVVAILATLTATMMISMNGATAKAKASSIAANLDSCHAAAMLYYSKYGDLAELQTVTTENMLKDSLKTWDKMKGDKDKDTIYYTAGNTSATNAPDKWAVLVDFSADPEAEEIAKALKRMRAYSDITAFIDFLGATPAFGEQTDGNGVETGSTTTTTKLYMTLITGEIKDGDTGFTAEAGAADSSSSSDTGDNTGSETSSNGGGQ